MLKTKNMIFSIDFRIAERLNSATKEYGINKSALVQLLLDEYLKLLESKRLSVDKMILKKFNYKKSQLGE